MGQLQLLAGPAAYRHIQQRGLSATDVSQIMGASGAAKWLTIYGLDRAIFAQWVNNRGIETGIDLFGTSVGAFKLAAAAQQDSAAALERLAYAYIEQRYDDDVSPQAIVRETQKILATVLTPQAINEVLTSSRFNFHCGAVWSRGLLGSSNATAQKLAMIKAMLLALPGRHCQRRMLGRAVFGPADRLQHIISADGFETEKIVLTTDNFRQAVLASGSIPVAMDGVGGFSGSSPGRLYRDGGLIDYHPLAANIFAPTAGLVLYPHFYPYLIEGWFDKFIPRRKVPAAALDNVLLIAPSAAFVASLPAGKIPDRQDFIRFKGRDEQRQQQWREVAQRSLELGEEWLQLVRTGAVADRLKRLPTQ